MSINWHEWVSATKTHNYMNKDPILDWLNEYKSLMKISNSNSFEIVPKLVTKPIVIEPIPKKRKSNQTTTQTTNQTINPDQFLMKQGKEFELLVVQEIMNRHSKQCILVCNGDPDDARSDVLYEKTLAAMKKKVPIIFQAVLRNYSNKTYGIADIVVRLDKLHLLINQLPNIKPSKQNKEQYVAVDIKFMTLRIRTDNTHLLNSGWMSGYKAQLLIYTQALGEMQNLSGAHQNRYAFLLGRSWDCNGRWNSSFALDRLGVIDYHHIDKPIVEQTAKAIEWIRRMRQEGSKWITNPPSVPELYPNMCNNHDSPWHETKERIANEIKEITSVWQCGPKNRDIAKTNGITKWTDPKCTAATLGFNPDGSRYHVLDDILDINRQDTDIVWPRAIQNNYRNWQHIEEEGPIPIEFIIDFETVQNFTLSPSLEVQNFGPMNYASQIIAIVGVRHIDLNGQMHDEDFVIENLNIDAERKMLDKFYQYILTTAKQLGKSNQGIMSFIKSLVGFTTTDDLLDNVNLYHWGNHEPASIKAAMKRHPGAPWAHTALLKENWLDFLDVMRDEPIVVKGAVSGFSLKTIVRAMHKHGLITANYNESTVSDGLSAMIQISKLAIEANQTGQKLSEMPEMRNIVKYNALDCLAVDQIIDCLRKNNGFVNEEFEEPEETDDPEESEESEETEETEKSDESTVDDESYEPPIKKRNTQPQSPLIIRPKM